MSLHEINIRDGTSSSITSDFNIIKIKSNSLLTTLSYALISVVLPSNYPDSVRKEYLEYQFWDSVQCMSSAIRSVLSTKALLKGAGVGSTNTTPLIATLVWISRDGIGMIGSLLFAYLFTDNFELNVKEWRYVADCLNNVGLLLDLLAPVLPGQYFLVISASTLCKACCGLIAGLLFLSHLTFA